ncbi:class I SAM-dependent methyltransferase [Gordonia sp. VNK1]|uniref:class I SAM-dependent methyltransferase n=1 Tax=Gordonia oleivorans TaxID=3156618 RepID=UPI0032B3EAA4
MTDPSPLDAPTADNLAMADADSVAERLFADALHVSEFMSVYIGERMGWYAELAYHGPTTSDDLARRTGTDPRYAREWLEMQAAYALVSVGLETTPPRFALSPGAAEVLLDRHSLAYLGELPRIFAAAFGRLPELLDAYRGGGGVSWHRFGVDARECQSALNRPWFERALAPALASVPEVDRRLRRPGARVADIGCGFGWSTIALATAYPEATLVGLDIDEKSVDAARGNADEAGVAARVRFELADAATLADAEPFDLAFAFECVHDMPRPVDVLRAVREALAPGGSMIVMDEAVSPAFAGPASEVDRLMYGFSLFICLPDGMSSTPSAATGTVMRPETLRTYAVEAGFGDMAVLPIDDFSLFRFYELIA